MTDHSVTAITAGTLRRLAARGTEGTAMSNVIPFRQLRDPNAPVALEGAEHATAILAGKKAAARIARGVPLIGYMTELCKSPGCSGLSGDDLALLIGEALRKQIDSFFGPRS